MSAALPSVRITVWETDSIKRERVPQRSFDHVYGVAAGRLEELPPSTRSDATVHIGLPALMGLARKAPPI